MKYIHYFKKEEWLLILWVSMSYFMNLFLLRGQNALASGIPNEFKNGYLISNAVGLLAGTFLYGYMADKYSRTNLLLISGVGNLLVCLCTYFIVLASSRQLSELEMGITIYAWRFVTGILLAGGFGVGITLIIEVLPRSKRLWGSAWVTAMGMLGICFYAALSLWIDPDTSINKKNTAPLTQIMGIGALLSLALLLFQWRYASELSTREQTDRIANKGLTIGKFWVNFFSNQANWKNLLLLGVVCLPVQFCINYLIPKLNNIGDNQFINRAYLIYYAVFFISVIITAYIYDKIQRTAVVIYLALIIQTMAIVFTMFVKDSDLGYLYLACAFLGSSGGAWWLITLIAVENTSAAHRASAGVFVSNFSRITIVILVSGFKINVPNGTGTTLLIAMIVGGAFIASLFLSKNFSPRLKKNRGNDLLPQDVIEVIRGHQEILNNDNNIEKYLSNCTAAMGESIFNALNTVRFAFYSIKDSHNGIINISRGAAIKDDELIEKPDRTKTEIDADWNAIREITMRLLEDGMCFSFTNQILHKSSKNGNHISGILLYHAPKPFRFLPAPFKPKNGVLPDGYKVYDLNSISIEAEHIAKFRAIEQSDQTPEILACLNEMARTAFENTSAANNITNLNFDLKDSDKLDNLKRALLLHKLDAIRYKRGYFAYFIAPFYAEQRGIAFLTTSYPVSAEQIRRLTDAVAYVMNGIVESKTKYIAREEVIEQTNHNLSHILFAINTNLEGLKYATEENEREQLMAQLRLHFDSIANVTHISNILAKARYQRKNLNPKDILNMERAIFPLSTLINESITTARDVLKNFSDGKTASEIEKMERCRLYLAEKVMPAVSKDFDNQNIICVRIAMKIILQDLLTNAIKHNSSEPEIRIELKDTEAGELPETFIHRTPNFQAKDYRSFSISNKNKEHKFKAEYDRILEIDGVDNHQSDTARGFGIDTIKRILKFDSLGATGLPWFIVPKKDCYQAEYVTIFLLIPAKDFYNEQEI